MLWISIEIPLRPAIGVLLRPTGYIFTVLACLYMALLKHLLTQFEFFTFLTKQAFCVTDCPLWRSPTTSNQVGGKGEHEHR